jgi:DNA gyrase subunit A
MVIAEEAATLLTVCENGFGKRTTLEDYRPQGRGGIGLINIKTSERNGSVVALKAVKDEDDIMIMTANGIIIRTGLEGIREIGRNTQGVRLIKLEENDKVVAVERVVKEEESDTSTPLSAGEPDASTTTSSAQEQEQPEEDTDKHGQ